MNQILVTEKKKKNKKGSSGPLEIKGIVRFFAVFIMLFGIVLASEGSYALYKEIDETRPENIPDVSLTRDGDTVILKVEHNTEISKVNYRWNDGEENVSPEGTTYVEKEILIPDGNNVLNITIIDMKNRQYQYMKEYNLEGVDITKPVVDVAQTEEGTANITITATDENAIKEMSYKVNDEQEVKIEATEENQIEIKEDITLPEGQNTLVVVAVDSTGNTTTYEKEIIVSSKPTIEMVSREGNLLTLKITDRNGLKDIVVNLNGQVFEAKDIDQNPNVDKNEVYVPLQLQDGNNVLSIEVTNVNGLQGKASTQIQ